MAGLSHAIRAAEAAPGRGDVRGSAASGYFAAGCGALSGPVCRLAMEGRKGCGCGSLDEDRDAELSRIE